MVTESFVVTDMTVVTSAVLFRSESMGSDFHANERLQLKKFYSNGSNVGNLDVIPSET